MLKSNRAWAVVENFEPFFIQFNQSKLVDVEKASRVALNCNKSQITSWKLWEDELRRNNGLIQKLVVGNVAAWQLLDCIPYSNDSKVAVNLDLDG